MQLNKLKTLCLEMLLWDKRAEETDLSGSDAESSGAARNQFFQAKKELSQHLKQKARLKWVVKGDENVAFFHGMVKCRLNRNTIKGLNVNGS